MTNPSPPKWLLRPLGIPGLDGTVVVGPVEAGIGEAGTGAVTLGRDPANEVVIPEDAFPHVSGHHSRVDLREEHLFVEDLGSKNGTYVNGRQVEQVALRNGDVIQLGSMGPRFAVVLASTLGETLPEIRTETLQAVHRQIGDSTITSLKDAMGVQDSRDVDVAVRAGSRRAIRSAITLVALVAVLVTIVIYRIEERRSAETRALRTVVFQLTHRLDEAGDTLDSRETEWKEQKRALVTARASLQSRIDAVEREGAAATGELSRLNADLKIAKSRLEKYDPVNMEQTRLRDVASVRRAVVLIEANVHLRDTRSRRRLHIATLSDGRRVPNLDAEGEIYTNESTGSGFCVSEEGWILTNAHVVRPPGTDEPITGPGGIKFHAETSLEVVFSGESRRHPAEVLRIAVQADQDVALIQITPFEGMPVVRDFHLDEAVPAEGTEVYLFGFPLGKLLLQEGDRVIASTFKGILSRKVGKFLQVDAAVHPGNSGGPVTDSVGNVIGIVTRVQTTPEGPLANEIGYVVPIGTAKRVWPSAD